MYISFLKRIIDKIMKTPFSIMVFLIFFNFFYIFFTGIYKIIFLNILVFLLSRLFNIDTYFLILINNFILLIFFYNNYLNKKRYKDYLKIFELINTPAGVLKNNKLVYGNILLSKIYKEVEDQIKGDSNFVVYNKQIYKLSKKNNNNLIYFLLFPEKDEISVKEKIFQSILTRQEPMQIFLDKNLIWSNTEKLNKFTRSLVFDDFIVKYNFSNFIPEFFSIIVDSLPLGLMIFDKSKNLVFFNNWVNKIHNHEKKTESIFVNSEVFNELLDNNFDKDTFMELKNGETVLIRCSNINESYKLVFVWYDVFENQLSNNKEHTQRLALLGYFLATTSHDVSNVSMALKSLIKQLSYLLVDNLAASDILMRMDQFLEIIISLVSQTLLLSRKNQPSEKHLNINKTIENILSISFLVKDMELSISLEATKNAAISSLHFFQIFLNLYQNAKDSLGNDGKISIYTKDIVLNKPIVEAGEYIYPGNYVEIKMEDNGHGIPEDKIKEVFTSFYTSKPNGTGLGLSIVYSLVRKARGYIMVESSINIGTSFRILLPIYKDPTSLPTNQRINILVIDDNEPVLLNIENDISKLYNVFTATNLNSAKNIINNTNIDLILSDMTIGKTDITEEIIEISNNLKNKLLFLTGRNLPDNFPHSYISKPCSKDELIEKIQTILEESKDK